MDDKNFKRFACFGFVIISVVVFCLGFMIGACCYGADFVSFNNTSQNQFQNSSQNLVSSADNTIYSVRQNVDLSYSDFASPIYNYMSYFYSYNQGVWSISSSIISNAGFFVSFNNGVPCLCFNSSAFYPFYLFEASYNDLISSSDIENDYSYSVLSSHYYDYNDYYSYVIPFSSTTVLSLLHPWNGSQPFSRLGLWISFGSLSSSYSIPDTLSVTTSLVTISGSSFVHCYFNFGSFYFEFDTSTANSPNGYIRSTSNPSSTSLTPFYGTRTINLGAGGYDLGFSAGYSAGEFSGYNDGYTSGYEDGYSSSLDNIEVVNNNISPFYNSYVVGAVWNSQYFDSYHTDNLSLTTEGFTGYLSTSSNDTIKSIYTDFQSNTGLNPFDYDFAYRFFFNSNVVGFRVANYFQLSFANIPSFLNNLFRLDLTFNFVDINGNYVDSYVLNDYLFSSDIIDLSSYLDYYCSFIEVAPSSFDYLLPYGFTFTSPYSVGFSSGYSEGYSAGIDEIKSQYNIGYSAGYNAGLSSGNNMSSYSFFSLIGSIVDAPISYFGSLFDFNILGTNIRAFLLGLFTLSVILIVVRLALGKK